MPKVKICGITGLADARVVVDAGADAFGLIFAESPRRVSPEQARDIVRAIGVPPCVPVGVFVDETPYEVIRIASFAGLRVVQLHGNERPGLVALLQSRGLDVVKSFRISAAADLAGLARYEPTAFLLDTFVRGKAGGTGKTFDWTIARDAAKRFDRVIVSGGLGVDNVLDAIRVAQPYGVDASSRLELAPGVKDPAKVREFVRLVRDASPPTPPDSPPWPR